MESKLLTPVKLANGIVLENRFVLSPMTTNSSTTEGYITEEDLLYAKRRKNTAPLQITGAAYVNLEGQLFEYGFSVHDDACIPGLKKMAQAMKSGGAKAILQLTHAGRFANHYVTSNKRAVGPSYMELNSPVEHIVHPLSIEDIQKVFEDVYEVIKNEAPKDFIFGYRATPEETRGEEVGYTVEEFNQLTDWLLERVPLSYMAIASWGQNIYLNRVRAKGAHYDRLINEVVYEHLNGRIPLIASGGINTIEKCEEAILHADMIGLSSPFVAEPDFVEKLKTNHIEDINLNVGVEDIERLAIPKAAFKDIVLMMDYGRSLPQHTRDEFRKLEENYLK